MENRNLQDAKRIVVKVGTSSLIRANGKINLQAIDELCYTLSGLVNEDKEVVLVSSGAVGVGLANMGLVQRPKQIPEQQALAAIGQSQLMTIYQQRFAMYSQKTSQILLTHDVLTYPESRENVLNTFNELLKWKVIPVVNENDTVAVDEMDHQTSFGDNDWLSAVVASGIDADLLIVLSDIDGLFDKNPKKYADANLISEVTEISEKITGAAGGTGSRFGTGGMATKIKAMDRMINEGRKAVLANGKRPSIIFEILNGKQIGTLFHKK